MARTMVNRNIIKAENTPITMNESAEELKTDNDTEIIKDEFVDTYDDDGLKEKVK